MHDLKSDQYPPGYLDKLERYQDASGQVGVNPLPGPLLEAILPEPLRAASLELRPLVPTDVAILKRLDHPLLKEFAELGKEESRRTPVSYEEEDWWELLFLWTRPIAEARAALAGGRQAFREAALRATGDVLPFSVIADPKPIHAALSANIHNAFATLLQHAPRSEGGGKVFTPPPAAPATGSAGG